ncbi:MAG: hypothetical protein ICV64_02890 [Thermoleophilia bacterium]|nr:hypothetical protein [Thermoleophilia bacterium]
MGAYAALARRLPDLPEWADVALMAGVLLPATFALVLLALPLREARGLALVGLALGVLAVVLTRADLAVPANLAKFAAAVLVALWFLGLFERASWIVAVAALVPLIDAVSVWRGPTRHIVTERPEVFGAFSVTFPLPAAGGFQLGLTDVVFFTLFLAAAARWKMRVGWTWLAMMAGLDATIVLTVYADPFGLGGLPALPGLSLAFLAANADQVVRIVRRDNERVTVTLPAADPAAAARFYRKALRARAAPADDATVRVAADWWADHELGFDVRDLARAHERATRNGAAVVQPPHEAPWGRAAAYRDPAGNAFVLVERA